MAVVPLNLTPCVMSLTPLESIEAALRLRMPAAEAADIADDAMQALAVMGWAVVPAREPSA